MITPARNIADYYNQTLNHYKIWWKLDDSLSVHYGFWNDNTKSFSEALRNTNTFLLEMADVQKGEHILDAGCGVGGSCFYLAEKKQAKVTGITLSEKQFEYANYALGKKNLSKLVDFELKDYTNTGFMDKSFDLVWAIESITSAADKALVAKEAHRILKPGGRMIIADYFKTTSHLPDKKNLISKWCQSWSMAPFIEIRDYISIFDKAGFVLKKNKDVTDLIRKTSKRMYLSYFAGALPSMVYNTFNKTSRFAKHHYKSGYYQYKALLKGLWEYRVILFEKPISPR